MSSVFISYANEDGYQQAHGVADSLADHRISVWIAERNITGSNNYAAEIPPAIASSDLVVIILSDAALESEHVQREAHLAVGSRRKILPVTFGRPIESLPDQWQYWIGTAQAVRFTSPSEVALTAVSILSGSDRPVPQVRPRFPTLRDALRSEADPDELKALVDDGLTDEDLGLIDLQAHLTIRIEADGSASLQYEHLVLNATGEVRGGLPQREVWFEHTAQLSVCGVQATEGQPPVRTKVVHDAGHILKFLPRFHVPLGVGDQTRIAYLVSGGRFVEDHYWSQSFPRFTRRFVVDLRAARELAWVEASRRDIRGDEYEVTNGIEFRHEGQGSVARAEAHWLSPGEVFTIKWGDLES